MATAGFAKNAKKTPSALPPPSPAPRLQPTDLRLGTSAGAFNLWRAQFGYDDPVTGDSNGNVYSQILDAPGLPATLTQAYSYDGVNRLTGVTETGGGTNWSCDYTYDAYGNRAANGAEVFADTPKAGDFELTNNRLKTAWADYDAAGNLITFKPDSFEWTASYDADNKQTAFCPGTESACSGVAPGPKTTYDYDGAGNRVRKIVNDTQKSLYVYDAFGNLAAEYADFQPTGPTGTQYRTTDHLGSTRIVTDAGGSILSRRDFFPFGEEVPANTTFGSRNLVTDGTYNDPSGYRQQFTGKGRDAESGLDYFGARYMGSSLGRFTTPDPLISSAHVGDPQRWNRFTYAANNPLRFTDPLGLYVWGDAAGGDASDDELRRRAQDRDLARADRRAARNALRFRTSFRNLLRDAMNAANSLPAGGDRDQALAAVSSFGAEGAANGVTVTSGNLDGRIAGQVSADPDQPLGYANGTFTANVTVTFDPRRLGGFAITTAHEGRHVADRQAFAAAASTDPNALTGPFNLTRYQTEFGAYTVSSSIARGLGLQNLSVGGHEIWNAGWRAADVQTLRSNGINQHLRMSPNYGLTPQNPGPFQYPR